jgi:DNA-binding NtrC family response regulator
MIKRALIVDDEANILPESRKMAMDQEVTVDVAQTLEEAITLLKMREYEFVIVGLTCANSLGEKELQILKGIKEDKGTTGIILLNGRAENKVTEEALFMGASYYYEKRLSTKILRDALRNVD